MSTPHKQFRRRLAKLEESLGIRSQFSETPLFVQVGLEAQQELSQEELSLFKSAEAAQRERRFHSLEEDAVMKKFHELKDAVARGYGFAHYGEVLRQAIASQPKSKPSATHAEKIIEMMRWGRDNDNHLHELRRAQQAPQANSSASVMVLDPSLEKAIASPLRQPNL